MQEWLTDSDRKEAKDLFSALNELKDITSAKEQFLLGFTTCLAYVPKEKETA